LFRFLIAIHSTTAAAFAKQFLYLLPSYLVAGYNMYNLTKTKKINGSIVIAETAANRTTQGEGGA
jgi:hypothetical protein